MGKSVTVPFAAPITITTPGTAVPLSSDHIFAEEVNITAQDTNAANIWYGDSTVIASTQTGTPLLPTNSNQPGTLTNVFLDEVFIDGAATEGVVGNYRRPRQFSDN